MDTFMGVELVLGGDVIWTVGAFELGHWSRAMKLLVVDQTITAFACKWALVALHSGDLRGLINDLAWRLLLGFFRDTDLCFGARHGMRISSIIFRVQSLHMSDQSSILLDIIRTIPALLTAWLILVEDPVGF